MIGVIKSKMIRWVVHVARTEEMRNAYNIFVGNPKGTDHLEDKGVDGKIILQWIVRRHGGKVWAGCICLRIGTNGGPS
jgi:hypothetical protein